MLRKILVPTDFSSASLSALEHAQALARSTNAELIVVHALELPVMPAGEVPFVSLTMFEDLERNERKRLASWVDSSRAKGVRARGVFEVGSARETILDYARSEQPELIVMSTHGRHGLSRLLLGSVVERVVRSSSVPVLVVRDTGEAARPSEATR